MERYSQILASNPADALLQGDPGLSRQSQRLAAVDENSPNELPDEATTLLNKAFDPTSISDARTWTQVSVALRQGQQRFRAELLEAYGGQCAVTGNRVVEVLEAAHIVPYRGSDTNHVTNGLLLRADIHSLYDQGLLAIESDTMSILVAPALQSTVYGKFSGKLIRLPANPDCHPSKQTLDLHRKNVGL